MLYKKIVLAILLMGVGSMVGDEQKIAGSIEEMENAQNKKVVVAEEAVPVAFEGGEKIILADPVPFENDYQGVVRVENSVLIPNYGMPWLPGKFEEQRGTAFLIGENLFMTNAHVASNSERLYISQYGDSRKLEAEILFIAHDCDLALLKVKDFSMFEGVKPFEFGSLPKLEDEVRVLGYPIGGNRLSVTRGIVSRIDHNNYAHSIIDKHLVLQVDAAINPGNSGGPVFMGGKVIGVAFQGLRNAEGTGYVIPIPVVKHFLEDVKDGSYDGYVSLGITDFPILNPAMREKLGLQNDEVGVLVGDVYNEGASAGLLTKGDVILSIDGYTVDSSGMINIDGERLSMNELAERKFKGDKLKVKLMRNKAVEEVEVELKPLRYNQVFSAEYDKLPRYAVFGGIVFQPVHRNTLQAYRVSTPEMAKALEDCALGNNQEGIEDLVFISQVLTDDVNLRFDSILNSIVEKVNGVEVKGLNHLNELLHPAEKPEYFVIEVSGNRRPIILEGKTIDEVNKRISEKYEIHESSRLNSDKNL